ncbi:MULTISPECIES: lasso peptide biosynthesis B2 protein [unclassified Paludibacterium]|uniref:lasso peptide biosynthesis B2 protein n=1 Tax=unclassified Paludibacterium TaxID=2618429 RepID=UPI001C04974E|nr:lasso peptide biosynthesis B2 protein [Paludibacterium sp. B53371]BEV73429.1 hypothetical protein THUN1379_29110 [Paludibacterium sp. THUN1379]
MTAHLIFAPHIHHLFVGERLILLDARRDRYLFIEAPDSLLLRQALQAAPEGAPAPIVQRALHGGVLRHAAMSQPLREETHRPAGVGLHEWQLPPDHPPPLVPGQRSRILWDFLLTRLMTQTRGLHGQFVRLARRQTQHCRPAAPAQCRSLALQIRACSLYLPFRTACLENALVTALWLARQSIACEFCIGFQLNPFLAHAWLNVGGEVLLDRPDLNHALHLLVRIP